ncbi:MAG: hypothetical protein Q8L77_12265 [Nitrospirota bacterium]|nr:hypothetical protein [Nitrospirota bacterium]
MFTTACGFSSEYKKAVAQLEAIEREKEEKRQALQRTQANSSQTTPISPPATANQEQMSALQEEERQKALKEDNGSEEGPTKDAYGANIAATPYAFVKLTPAQKAALHWAAAQEYWRLHNTRINYDEVAIVAEMHGTTANAIFKKFDYWKTPGEKFPDFFLALPHKPKGFEKWRAQFIEKQNTPKGLVEAVAGLDQGQRIEQEQTSLNRRGCEWMQGKYYLDLNPSSLCTPVISACVEGNCQNGHGTYIAFDGRKFVGEFKNGKATTADTVYIPGTCVTGDCRNGQGTYTFSDGSKYVGSFKNGKPNGQGTKTWEIGLSYTGEFQDGKAKGKGTYTRPAQHKLSQNTCLKGNCRDGQGVMIYSNDTKYVGEFKGGEPNGKGIYYWRDGEALAGEFELSKLKEGGNYIMPDGSIIVQSHKRGWHKTYMDEEDAAIQRYMREHFGEIVVEVIRHDIRAHRDWCDAQSSFNSYEDWLDCN